VLNGFGFLPVKNSAGQRTGKLRSFLASLAHATLALEFAIFLDIRLGNPPGMPPELANSDQRSMLIQMGRAATRARSRLSSFPEEHEWLTLT
jgi:hypothetical protein